MKAVEKFFLEASFKTYAGDVVPKSTIEELPKSKVFRYEEGDFLYWIRIFSSGILYSPTGKGKKISCGQTTIWHQCIPVWWMQYHGEWDPEDDRIIPFLKQALKVACERGEFIGGRGPKRFEGESLTYYNDYKGNFASFKGLEQIKLRSNHKPVFWYRYFGSVL